MVEHLRRQGGGGSAAADQVLFDAAAEGRLHDVMLLDQLHRLATDGNDVAPRNLEAVAREYAPWVGVSKRDDDAYRMNYRCLLGIDLAAVEDDGWFLYPAKDVRAPLAAFAALATRCQELIDARYRESISPDTVQRWGILSESIQVMGAIALASLSRNGLHVDDGHRVRLRVGLESRMLEQAERLDSIVAGDPRLASSPGGATLFKGEAAGALVRTPKGPCLGRRSRCSPCSRPCWTTSSATAGSARSFPARPGAVTCRRARTCGPSGGTRTR